MKQRKQFLLKKKSLQNNWKLSFDEGWDTPKSIEIPELKSLTQLENEAIKHYSGTTTYSKIIQLKRYR